MQPENWPESFDLHTFVDGNNAGQYGLSSGNYDVPTMQSMCSSSEGGMFKDTPQGRALAASKNHKEAEKRRRQRINSHLDSLRTLLSCNSKTDKASLLAKVIQRVKDLKQQTSEIMELEAIPSEADEIMVTSSTSTDSSDETLIIKASFCCEDRSDLIPDLIETLKALRLSPLRAEMVTFGGRIRNVLIVSGDKDPRNETVQFLKEALGSLVQRSNPDRLKRQRRIK